MMSGYLVAEGNESRRDTGREVPIEEKWLNLGEAGGLEKKR